MAIKVSVKYKDQIQEQNQHERLLVLDSFVVMSCVSGFILKSCLDFFLSLSLPSSCQPPVSRCLSFP